MRFVGTALVLLLAACASASTEGLPAPEPMGTLAQVMRGILFPNSNILFDVQSVDPANPPPAAAGAGATATFSGIYSGWQMVENAAIALGESANLITIPGTPLRERSGGAVVTAQLGPVRTAAEGRGGRRVGRGAGQRSNGRE